MSELDLNTVKAGEYVLLALSWDEPTSKPGQPYDFVTHRQGDTVTLNVQEARRLMAAGAVAPKKAGKAPKADPNGGNGGGNGGGDEKPEQTAGIDAIVKYVGEDKERAAEFLAGELARDQKDQRSTLVKQLTAIAEV